MASCRPDSLRRSRLCFLRTRNLYARVASSGDATVITSSIPSIPYAVRPTKALPGITDMKNPADPGFARDVRDAPTYPESYAVTT